MQRRLSAILAADMVGYSRLIAADEQGTIARQKEHRAALIDPKIAQYGGRIVKTMGDGLLVEFSSAVDAVQCALDIQRTMPEREAEVSESSQIRYRVGINLGDISIDGDDVLGDGVNVAARLEGLAKPGGICISDIVYQTLQGKLAEPFSDLGEQSLKNMDRKIRVWKWIAEEPGVTRAENSDALPLPDKPSIAVLPFVNLSNDPEQDFFCDGMAEDIITALAKIPDLLVIAPNSIRIYKGQDVEPAQVSRDQGVRFILKGSVRKVGNRARISTQLIDATTEHQLWAERYNRELEDMFAVQDEITQEVVTALDVRFSRGEQARSYWSGTRNLEAWGCIRRAAALIDSGTTVELWEAKRLCKKALEHDPNYAMAWVQLGWAHHHEVDVGIAGTSKGGHQAALGPAFDCAKRALELEPSNPEACSLLSSCYLSSNQHEQAIAMSEKAVDMAPNNADILGVAAVVQIKSGQPESGLGLIRKAMRLCPINYEYFPWVLGTAYRLTGQLEAATEAFAKGIKQMPDSLSMHVGLVSTLGELERIEDAKKHAREIVRLDPDFSIKRYTDRLSYKDHQPVTRIEEGLRKAGLPE